MSSLTFAGKQSKPNIRLLKSSEEPIAFIYEGDIYSVNSVLTVLEEGHFDKEVSFSWSS